MVWNARTSVGKGFPAVPGAGVHGCASAAISRLGHEKEKGVVNLQIEQLLITRALLTHDFCQHEFGSLEVYGKLIFWKIAYYDRATYGTDAQRCSKTTAAPRRARRARDAPKKGNGGAMAAEAYYHCSVSSISRAGGRSIVAAAAYRAGEKLIKDSTGLVHDYTRRQGVLDAFRCRMNWMRRSGANWRRPSRAIQQPVGLEVFGRAAFGHLALT